VTLCIQKQFDQSPLLWYINGLVVWNQLSGGMEKRHAVCNKKYLRIYAELKKIIDFTDPTFKFTSIQVNKNVSCKPHINKCDVWEKLMIDSCPWLSPMKTITVLAYKVT